MQESATGVRLFQKVAHVVVIALLGAAAFDATPAVTRAAPVNVEALLIGDSVLNGLAQSYSAAGRAALAARHSFILDSAGCRRLITTSCRIPPGSAPTNAITVLRGRAGQFDRALVVAVGYDDPSSGQFGVGAAVDVMIAEARRQGIHHVVWLTYREAGGAGNEERFRQSNAVLRNRTDPELVIADWASRSAAMPSSWFSADGIHLGPQASAAMGDLIGDTLDQLVPARCASGVWSGTDVAGGVVDTTSAAGGLNLMPTPVRAVDTRDLPGKVGAGRSLSVPIAGVNGVPADATAAVVSVTAVEPCADTFLTVFPCGSTLPLASMVNADALTTVANSGVVRLGAGSLCVFASQPTDVLVDVSGWIAPAGLRSTPVAPVRLVDTRAGLLQALPVAQNRLRAGQLLTVDLASWPGFDPTDSAATVNLTAAGPSGDGFLTVLPGPCTDAGLPPTTSNLNVTTGRDVAASATTGLGGGQLCIFTSVDTDVIVDLQALHGAEGGAVSAVDPRRITDTRTTSRLVHGQSSPIQLDSAVAAVIVNLTAVDPSGSGYLALHPCDSAVPTVSNVNVVAGATVANRAVVSTAGTSRFCVYSSVDTDAVIDIEGYVTPS
ncbi:MAG: hypothetical protein QOJ08_1096 [Ilumatobacteraceae bacterium]|jgi:hypothetical protein